MDHYELLFSHKAISDYERIDKAVSGDLSNSDDKSARKRPYCEDNYQQKKKIKFDEIQSESQKAEKIKFSDFSEDLLLILFSHIAPSDLISLSKTCVRLNRVVGDWTLWKNIKICNSTIPITRLDDFVPYLLKCTESVQISFQDETLMPAQEESDDLIVNEQSNASLSFFLSHLSSHCINLHTLHLENVTIDSKKFPMQMFPSTLKNFSLKFSKVVNLSATASYFYGFDSHFPDLQVLNLSWCSWFTPHSLIALSKGKTLEKLYLKGCRKLKNCVPYTSLSVRFGFKALKVLDLRFTYISDSEISIIYDLPCLSELYLAAPIPKRLSEFSISDRSITLLCSLPSVEEQIHEVALPRRQGHIALVMLPQIDVEGIGKKISKSIHKLVVTGYPSITDITLRHASECLRGLKYLDIRGSSCTDSAIEQFRLKRPDVQLLSGTDPEPHPEHLHFSPPSPSDFSFINAIQAYNREVEEDEEDEPPRIIVVQHPNRHHMEIINNFVRDEADVEEDAE